MVNEILLDRYQLLHPLGVGGFGETFVAIDLHSPSRKKVVIKCLKPIASKIDSKITDKLFFKEASILEDLGSHWSKIPTLFAYVHHQEQYYLIQEYIEGQNLAQLGIISPEQCAFILSSLLETLQYIHGKNIIHRDIKPENIIIRDRDQLPVLIDFGAVKESMGSFTNVAGSIQTSVVIGTKGFMTPEQSAGRAVFSTDIYALSLTMIYTLTGKLPLELPCNPVTGELEWQNLVANLPPELNRILTKGSQMEIAQRYSTAEQMYADLHRSLTIHPNQSITEVKPLNNQESSPPGGTVFNATKVVAPPESPRENNNESRAWRVILLAVLFLMLGIVGGYLVFQTINAMNQTQQQLAQLEAEKAQAEAKLEEERIRREAIQKQIEEEQLEKQRQEAIRKQIEAEELRQKQLAQMQKQIEEEELKRKQLEENNNNQGNISVDEAIGTVESLYNLLSSKQFDQAEQLFSEPMRRKFSPSFFEQFDRVTVEDLQVTSQTSNSINLIGVNTYVYFDGSTQRETRSYMVRKIGGVAQINSSEFIEVIKPR